MGGEEKLGAWRGMARLTSRYKADFWYQGVAMSSKMPRWIRSYGH